MSEIRFIHAHIKGGGRATVAWEDWNDGEAHIAIAWCSPKDHFRKDRGRLIATGRLKKQPWCWTLNLTTKGEHTFIAEETILNAVYDNPNAVGTPEWAWGEKLFIPREPRGTAVTSMKVSAQP